MDASDLTILTGTFGDDSWIELAHERAGSSVPSGVAWVHRHDETLAKARNAALAEAETEFVAVCDADDELEDGFVEAMVAGEGDVRVPRVAWYRNGRPTRAGVFMPRVWRHKHDCTADCLRYGSWIVVGAAVRRSLAERVGGWREYEVYEDFDLFQRLWLVGAEIVPCPAAVYRQHRRRGSRNHSLPKLRMNEVHEEIERANGVSREAGWNRPNAVAA